MRPQILKELDIGMRANPLLGLYQVPNFQLKQFSAERCVFSLHLWIKTILCVNELPQDNLMMEKKQHKENKTAIHNDLQ